MMLGQLLINAILWPPAALLLRRDVQGLENLPAKGPALVIMNHINFLDVIMPGLFLPREVVMLAKRESFRLPVLGPFIWAYGCLSVRRGELDLQAMRGALNVLKKGQVLVVAPEGTRSGHGQLQAGHEGSAFVAALAEVPVVPFVQYGHEHYLDHFKRLRRSPLHIRVGEPFRFVVSGRRRRDELRAMTDEAMYRLAALLPHEYRGVYADLDRATTRYIAPCRLPDQGEAG